MADEHVPPIPDPWDRNRAILPDGQIGRLIRWLPGPIDPERITMADLDRGIDVGYVNGPSFGD